MRRKLIVILVLLVTIPIIILYFISARLFENSTRDHLKILNTKNIVSVKESLGNFFDGSIEVSMYPIDESNLRAFLTATGHEPNFYTIFNNANNILLTMPFTGRGGIVGIDLLSKSGNMLQTDYTGNNITQTDIQQADAANGYHVWGNSTDIYGNKIITVCRLIKNYPDMQKLGYIKVIIGTASISEVLNIPDDIQGIEYYLVDNKNEIIYSSKNDNSYRKLFKYFNTANLGDQAVTQMVNYKGTPYFISGTNITRTPFSIYSISTEGTSFGTQPTILNVLGITAVVLILTCILLSLIFSEIIVRPLQEMARKMKSVSLGDFSVRISVRGNDEIKSLADQFNLMTEKLNHLYTEVYEGRIRQNQAELSALLAQINPHFLHNTLDTIYWMSEMGDTKSVSEMVTSLSNIMRFTLPSNSSGITPLHSELEYLQSYINIQKVRYSDSISFSIKVDPGLSDCQVLKLILQPLVENAIIHGIVPIGKGYVRIVVYQKDNKLIYEVHNNGISINIKEINELLNNASEGERGFALKNIRDRISLKYGEGYGVSISLENDETVFIVTQPIVRDV